MHFTDIIILFLSGCAAGTISGLLGVGGGVINVAIFTYYFDKMGVSDMELTRYVLSNSFLAIFFSSLSGSYQQFRSKNFFLREVLLIAITTVTFSAGISFLIAKFDWYSKKPFTIFFSIVLTGLMLKMLYSIRGNHTPEFKDEIKKRHYPVTGVFTGLFSALSGLGGGVVTVPLLSDIHKLKIKKATSISLGVMPLMAVANTIVYSLQTSGSIVDFTLGYIKPDITIPLVAGVIIFAPIGVKLSKILGEKTIRIIFISIVSIVIFRMLYTIL